MKSNNKTLGDLKNKKINVVNTKNTVRKVKNISKPNNAKQYKINAKQNKVINNVVLKSDIQKKARENIQHVTTLNTLNKKTARTISDNINVTPKNEIYTINKKNIEKVKQSIKSKAISNSDLKKNIKGTSKTNVVPKMMSNVIKNNINKNDNTESISVAISAGEVAVKAFKTSEAATDFIVKKSRGVYSVGKKVVTVKRKSNFKNANLQLKHQDYLQLKSVAMNKVRKANTVKRINNAVAPLKTEYKKTVTLTNKTKYIYLQTNKRLNVIRGITKGTFKIQVKKSTLAKIKNKSIKAISKSGVLVGKTIKTASKLGVKTGYKISKKSLKAVRKGYKGVKIGVVKVGDFLVKQDDFGSQALGYGIKYGNLTIKGVKATPKVVKGSIKKIKTATNIPIKTGKSIGKFVSATRSRGIKATLEWQRKNATKMLKKTGGSIVSTIIEGFKQGTKKALTPIIIVIVVLFGITSLLQGAGAGAYQAVFGSTATKKDTGEDLEEREWLTQQITKSRSSLVKQVKSIYNSNLKSNGGSYDFVRLFNSISNTEIDLTDVNILSSVYSVSEYLEYIQPIFHVILLTQYDLEPTQYEMEQIYNDIWQQLTSVTTKELPVEYCNGGNREADSNVHANIVTCPNHSDIQYHADNINVQLCSCDYIYYECLGHKGNLKCSKQEHRHDTNCYDSNDKTKLTCKSEEHTHTEWVSKDNAGCYNTNFCNTVHMATPCANSSKHLGCNGYYICNGHKILAVNITVGTFNDLLNKYFKNRINELEAKVTRTENEEKELQELKDNYQICMEYLTAYTEEYGGGNAGGNGSVVNLDGVQLTQVTEFACQFVGNPYKYGGTDINNGIDCSAFVQYVYAHFGVTLPRVASDQCACGTLVSSLAEAKAGDLIFYSDDGTDSGVYHVTMYLGEGKMVHASNSKPYPEGGIKVSNVYGSPYKIKRIAQ